MILRLPKKRYLDTRVWLWQAAFKDLALRIMYFGAQTKKFQSILKKLFNFC